MEYLTTTQADKINKTALAQEHDCTRSYVSQVLRGKREANTKKSRAILKDGNALIAIIESKKTA